MWPHKFFGLPAQIPYLIPNLSWLGLELGLISKVSGHKIPLCLLLFSWPYTHTNDVVVGVHIDVVVVNIYVDAVAMDLNIDAVTVGVHVDAVVVGVHANIVAMVVNHCWESFCSLNNSASCLIHN